jgi:hypothetical protein
MTSGVRGRSDFEDVRDGGEAMPSLCRRERFETAIERPPKFIYAGVNAIDIVTLGKYSGSATTISALDVNHDDGLFE